VLSQPFASTADFDRLQLPASDARRTALALANPLSEDEPLLRTTLLPGLLRLLARNVGRGSPTSRCMRWGRFPPAPRLAGIAPILPVDRGPTAVELASLEAGLPAQPLRLAWCWPAIAKLAGWWAAAGPPDGRTPSRPSARCCG